MEDLVPLGLNRMPEFYFVKDYLKKLFMKSALYKEFFKSDETTP